MQVIIKDDKKEDRLCIKSPTTEFECAKGVFKIHSLISSVIYVKITGHGQHE